MAEELGISERVRFTGLINNPTDEGIFDASDLYCQPSLWQEACPLAVLEAMSLKLAVVASRIGGLPELLEDGKTGLLAPAGDADAVGDCLLQLIRDEELRGTMGEAGYQSVVARHQLDQQVGQYVRFVVEGLPDRDTKSSDCSGVGFDATDKRVEEVIQRTGQSPGTGSGDDFESAAVLGLQHFKEEGKPKEDDDGGHAARDETPDRQAAGQRRDARPVQPLR